MPPLSRLRLPVAAWLVVVVTTGTAVRFALALSTDGVAFDLQSYALVGQWLTDGDPWDVYSQATATFLDRWPYPPGLFPLLAVLPRAAAASPVELAELLRLGLAAGDAVLALLVHAVLRARGSSARTALAGAALVSLGPTVVVVSGHHGQLDAVTWLPAVAALHLWERLPVGRRALPAGLLVGAAASIKTVPLLVLLALLATARSRREALTAAAAAVGVPAALLLPFVVADPGGVFAALQYRGIPGYGGLSLLAQPSLAELWLTPYDPGFSALSARLQDVNGLLTLAALASTALVCRRARTPAPRAAVLLVLAVLVAGVNVTIAYCVWALVLMVAAGMLRGALALQVWLLVPTWMVYTARSRPTGWSEQAVHLVYVPMSLALLAGCAVALTLLVRSELRRGPAPAPTDRPVAGFPP